MPGRAGRAVPATAWWQAALRPGRGRRAPSSRRNSSLLCTGPSTPRGCLLVQGALAVGEASETVREALAVRRAAVLDAIAQHLRQGVKDSDVPVGMDVDDPARYIMVANNGIAVQAAGGATRDELSRCVDIAMRAGPS
ncbi:hypothetical protein WDA79_07550 [Streptomyces sp. A475]|uniref:TetR family transcriptional regulator C-terminal domain-containing protein n=1 Tax=unclassified Streptomyces TaxID=2593676 RepID=UPI0030C95D0B